MKKVQVWFLMMFVSLAYCFAQENKSFAGYENYDFVPGDKIIYYEDFLQDTLYKFPQKWLSNSPGEVIQLKQFPGINWYKMYAGSTNATDGVITFAENTTVEFDLIANVGEDSTKNIPEIQIYFHSQLPDQMLGDYVPGKGGFGIKFNGESVSFYSWKNGDYTSVNNEVKTTELVDHKNKKIHMALCIQKSRVLFYINEQKVVDMPDLSPEGIPALDRISFYSNDINVNSTLLISNLVVTTGIANYRDKLSKMGKFSTQGIKFEAASDKIKPESYPVLKEIANIMNDTRDTKFMITSYTDSDGDEAMNMVLSQKRAESVKKALVEMFEVEEKSLSTEGKGETAPINKNLTNEDKAMNRRIEITRL
jgi:outer membrane protein OmpA-like peptidoglycan-associated protein